MFVLKEKKGIKRTRRGENRSVEDEGVSSRNNLREERKPCLGKIRLF